MLSFAWHRPQLQFLWQRLGIPGRDTGVFLTQLGTIVAATFPPSLFPTVPHWVPFLQAGHQLGSHWRQRQILPVLDSTVLDQTSSSIKGTPSSRYQTVQFRDSHFFFPFNKLNGKYELLSDSLGSQFCEIPLPSFSFHKSRKLRMKLVVNVDTPEKCAVSVCATTYKDREPVPDLERPLR